jgi:hypothetical protein
MIDLTNSPPLFRIGKKAANSKPREINLSADSYNVRIMKKRKVNRHDD